MFDPLARLLPPPSLWNNPVFRTDARSIRFGSSWFVLRKRLLRWGIQMLVLLAVCCVLALVVQLLTLNPNSYSYRNWRTGFMSNFIAFAMMGSLALNFILDFLGISAALGTISSDFTDKRADLIRLSLIRPTQLVAAKYALAQVRVFRMTVRIMWLRLWVVLMGVGMLIWGWLDLTPASQQTVPFEVGLGIAVVFVLSCATYIIEPYWRMKAVTAAGVAVSSRARHGVSATMSAGFALIAFWISQGFVLLLLAFLLQLMTFYYFNDPWITTGTFFLFWGVTTTVIYVYYAALVRNSLYQAAYRLATLDN